MCGRFYLQIMPNAEQIIEELFGFPFLTLPVPPMVGGRSPYNEATVFRTSQGEIKAQNMLWNLALSGGKEFKPTRNWYNYTATK